MHLFHDLFIIVPLGVSIVCLNCVKSGTEAWRFELIKWISRIEFHSK